MQREEEERPRRGWGGGRPIPSGLESERGGERRLEGEGKQGGERAEETRDQETRRGTASARKESPQSALSPGAGSPRKAHLHEAAKTATRSHGAPGASGRRLPQPEARSAGVPHWPGRHRPPSGRRRSALRSLSPPLSWRRAPGVFERRRTRGPPASAPHSRSRSAIRASTGRAPRLGAHVRRFLLHAPRTLCCRAAEPQSSKCSSCGSSCGPSASALGRRRRCSAGRGRDPRGGTSATPKVQPWRRAPASARSTRPLPGVAAAAEEGRREG